MEFYEYTFRTQRFVMFMLYCKISSEEIFFITFWCRIQVTQIGCLQLTVSPLVS